MSSVRIKLNIRTLIIIINMLGLLSFPNAEAKPKTNSYEAMDLVSSTNSNLNLYINSKTKTLDLAKTNRIRVRLKVRDLYNSNERTSSFKISLLEINGAARKFISSQQLSLPKGFKRSRVLSLTTGEFTSPSKNLEIDLYDTAGNLINTYKTTIEAINLASQVSGARGINLSEANCDGTRFGDCQIDYLLQRVHFEAKPQRQASTTVVKNSDGLYKVTFPFPRTQFKFLGRRVKRKPGSETSSNGGSTLGLGDILTVGKIGIGIPSPEAFLHIQNGSTDTPSILVEPGTLINNPKDGAIEFDGNEFYITKNGAREKIATGDTSIGAQGPAGPAGATGPAGASGSGNSLENGGVLNGTVSFGPNGVLQNAILNGSFIYTDGNETTNHILRSDTNGLATWTSLGSIFNGSGLTTNAAGTNGQIQFNESSNLSADSNFHWDNTNKRLGIGTTGPAASLQVNGFALIGYPELNTTALGSNAARYNNGDYVNAIGHSAAESNIGTNVNALGGSAAQNNNGNSVNAFGDEAAQNNTSFYINAFGLRAAQNNNRGYVNAMGREAAQHNNGSSVNAMNYIAAQYNNGTYVNAFGPRAARYNNGDYLNAIGRYTARWNRGDHINALGFSSADNNTGDDVNAIGRYSARYNSGDGVIAIGRDTLNNNNGDYNIAIGYEAGENLNNGSENILIGYEVEAIDNNGDSQLNIGDTIYGDLANGEIALGSATTNPDATLDLTGSFKYTDGNQTAGYVLSSDTNGQATWTNITTLGSNGDNLGNHIATDNLDLATHHILDAGNVNGVTGNFTNININQPAVAQALYINQGSGTREYIFGSQGAEFTTSLSTGKRWNNDGQLEVQSQAPTRPISFFKKSGSQTANMSEWVNTSNGILTVIDNGGNFGIGRANLTNALEVNGSIMIVDGNQAAGYVLSSDANGQGTWTNITTLDSNGDNLGNHTATTSLLLNNQDITNGDEAYFSQSRDIKAVINTASPYFGFSLEPANGTASWSRSYNFFGNGETLGGFGGRGTGANLEYLYISTKNGANQNPDPLGTYFDDTGDVGIGKRFPNAKLHVNGDIAITDGTQANGFVLSSDANGVGTWVPSTSLELNGSVINGAIASAIISSLSAPDGSPNPALKINNGGQMEFHNDSEVTAIIMNGSPDFANGRDLAFAFRANGASAPLLTGGIHIGGLFSNGAHGTYIPDDGEISTNAYDISLRPNGNLAFTLKMNGDLGLGYNNPVEKLHVNGNVMADNFIGNGTGLTSLNGTLINSAIASAIISSLSAPDGSPNPALSVDNNGLVSIGNLAPRADLHVGNAVAGVTVDLDGPTGISDNRILVGAGGGNGRTASYNIALNDNGSRNQIAKFFLTDGVTGNGGWGHWQSWSTGGQQPYYLGSGPPTATPWLKILTNGDTGIGYNNPLEKLHVNGNVMADNFIGNGTGLTSLNGTLINSAIASATISSLSAPDGSPNPALSIDNAGNLVIDNGQDMFRFRSTDLPDPVNGRGLGYAFQTASQSAPIYTGGLHIGGVYSNGSGTYIPSDGQISTNAQNISLMPNGNLAVVATINGFVGIGTASPNAQLEINNSSLENGGILIRGIGGDRKHPVLKYGNVVANGTPNIDSFRLRYDVDFDGIASNDYLVFDKTDGNGNNPDGGIAFTNTGNDGVMSTALLIAGNNNVAINKINPSSELDVNGTVTALNFAGNGSNLTGLASGLAGAVQFSNASSNLESDEANLFWNDATNRLGVGTNNPSSTLEVNGAALIDGAATIAGNVNIGFTGENIDRSITIHGSDATNKRAILGMSGGTFSIYGGVGNQNLQLGTSLANVYSRMHFYTNENAPTNTDGGYKFYGREGGADKIFAMITRNGEMGINTASPEQDLTVNGNLGFGPTGSNLHFTPGAGFNDLNLNGGHLHAAFGLWARSATSNSRIMGIDGTTTELNLYTSGNPKLTIDSSDNVGIGITSPKAKLHVNGDIMLKDSTELCVTANAGLMKFNGSSSIMQYCNGSSWINMNSSSGGDYILLADEKASGTVGGACPVSTWDTRDLNTIITDDTGSVSITANEATLSAGTYECDIEGQFSNITGVATPGYRMRLFNSTDATVIAYSLSGNRPGNTNVPLSMKTKFTLASSKDVRVEAYCNQSAPDTENYGMPSNIPLVNERYLRIRCKRY